jgi:hypothetical protein
VQSKEKQTETPTPPSEPVTPEPVQAPEKLTLSVHSASLFQREYVEIIAYTPIGLTDYAVKFSSSDEHVAYVSKYEVNENGDAYAYIFALTDGTTTITATYGDQTDKCEVKVKSDLSADITGIRHQKISYDKDKDAYIINFALMWSETGRDLPGKADVKIRFENEDGVTVYEDTVSLRPDHFEDRSRLVTIEVPCHDMIAGKTEKGVAYFSVSNPTYFTFKEYSSEVDNLPTV